MKKLISLLIRAAQIIVPVLSLHPILNLPIYIMGIYILRTIFFMVLVSISIASIYSISKNEFPPLLVFLYNVVFSYLSFYMLTQKKTIEYFDIKLYLLLNLMIVGFLAVWLFNSELIGAAFNQQHEYRFSGWAREPSFFSEFVFTVLIISIAIGKRKYVYVSMIISLVFIYLSSAASFYLSLLLTFITYIFSFIARKLNIPAIVTAIAITLMFICSNFLIYEFSMQVGSWRAISNVESLLNTDLLPFGDNSKYAFALENMGLEYIETSIYSLFFYLQYNFGIIIGTIIFLLVVLAVRNAISNNVYANYSIIKSAFLISGYLNAWFISPKWLIISALPFLFMFKLNTK